MRSENRQYFRYFTYIKPFGRLPIVKNYGPAIFAILTISLLTIFAIKPTIETILVLQKQMANQEEILKKITEKANNLSLGKKNYDNLDQTVKTNIFALIPDNLNLKSLIRSLEETANSNEASISALQIQPLAINVQRGIQKGSLAEVSFIFNTEGNYSNLTAILQNLKRSSRLISIEALSLSKTSNDKSLIMSLTGKAYYLK